MKIIKQCYVVDENNNIIVPLGYDDIEICGEKFKVLLDEKWGLFCSKKKQLIVNCNYDSIKFGLYSLGIECYIVEKDSKFGVFSVIDDRFIASCEYDEIVIYNDICFKIRQSSKWGLIDYYLRSFLYFGSCLQVLQMKGMIFFQCFNVLFIIPNY